MRRDEPVVTWERIVQQLQYAHAMWQPDEPPHTPPTLSAAQAEAFITQAKDLLAAEPSPHVGAGDSALIVTKAPHTGSDRTVVAIVARCLAFGARVQRLVRQPPDDADRIAHALYPDIWLNFNRLPSGDTVWSRIDAIFDNDDYAAIFGQRYRRSSVVTGHQACLDNGLTSDELMSIWNTGREPLTRDVAADRYGRSGAGAVFDQLAGDVYQWYRGTLPVGIHKISPSLMAFALRHERLYEGRPTVVLNGHYTLLSQRFMGVDGVGPAVIQLALDDYPTISDIRTRLVGSVDQPGECRPGSIRRDCLDGMFDTDAPGVPVVPWANAVHASDGYLAGAVEAAAVLGRTAAGRLPAWLRQAGYTSVEIDALIMKDPIVVAHGEEQRLTRRTARRSRDECMAMIRSFFPPLGEFGPPPSAHLLSALIGSGGALSRATRDMPCGEKESRRPDHRSIRACADLPDDLGRVGRAMIAAGGLGLMAPLAGSGGRFGGYDVAEGTGARLKPLVPIFRLKGQDVSAMDVRAAHVRFLGRQHEVQVPMILSCNGTTQPSVESWLTRHPELEATVVRVPEMYRIRMTRWALNVGAPEMSDVDDILRDPDGRPLLKPSGSLGLLLSAAYSGTLRQWYERGVQVVVAANADDVGFRLDPRILGMFAASPTLDAVVLTTPICIDQNSAEGGWERGGLLRERHVGGTWSAYVEEHAEPDVEAGSHEQLSTNQLYFRIEALRALFSDAENGDGDEIRRRLPVYFEVKEVSVGSHRVGALHAYQPYGDVLRLLDEVTALTMDRIPRPGQVGGYAPLKSPSDVSRAQAVLDTAGNLGDKLL